MGINIPTIPYLYRGTDNWQGGFARMNEGGRGELTYLPNGSIVVPHDISMRYARESARAERSGGNSDVRQQHDVYVSVSVNDANIYDTRDIATIARDLADHLSKEVQFG